MSIDHAIQDLVPFDEIDITDELAFRPSRPPDHRAEAEALVAIAESMTEAPGAVLQRLADAALELCRADSAGISLVEGEGRGDCFRRLATAGDFRSHCGDTLPRDSSPCGAVVDRDATLLMADPARHYGDFDWLRRPVLEILLVPFHRGRTAIGTVWVVASTAGRRFDAEDARLVASLARLAAAVVQSLADTATISASVRKLEDLESRLDAALAAGAVTPWIWDIGEDRVVADRNLARLFSVPPEVADGGPLAGYLRMIHPDDSIRVADSIRRAVRSDGEYEEEYRVLQPDDSARWVVARGRVERDGHGRPARMAGVLVDITERRLAADALRASEEFNRRVVESSSDCIKVLDLEGRLLTLNAPGCRLLEIDDPASCLHRPWLDFWPAEGRGTAVAALEAARRGEPSSFRGECPTSKGTPKWWDVAVTPILGLGARGRVERILCVSRDVTAAKRAEEALRVQAEALVAADRRKDEFLAMLAHELRNPLAAIGHAVKLAAAAGPLPDNVGWSIDVIDRQMRHLSRLIDDLLDVSRISQGKVRLRRERIDAAPILASAAATVGPLVAERRHRLHLDVDRDGLWVDADATRLEQVVVNLLNNAAKYSDDGGEIRLSASRVGGEVVVRVKDSGVGIPPERLPEMFELFAQGDRTLARSEGGLGIGLTVVKKLVEMHDGRITASSAGVGLGSEFVVRLPAADRPPNPVISAPVAPKAEAPATRESRILVVDDNEDTARGMARLLRLAGHRTATAYTGPQAIDVAREFRPGFVLLDIGLPEMDGYEVAARLRRDEGGRHAVIVAISGYGQADDRRRTAEAGFDHHLTKPVDFAALEAIIAGAD